MKIIWYIKRAVNLLIVCVRLLLCCIMRPKRFGELLFSLYSTVNEFHQTTHGRLKNFEGTALFKKIKDDFVFARTNVFNVDARVARPMETVVLSALIKALDPRSVFEFGTYNGFTTLHFAKNTAPECVIHTLDLPPDFDMKMQEKRAEYSYDDLLVVKLSMENIDKRMYRHHPEREKIKEIFADSVEFDFSPYEGKMDVVYIDGNHSYAYVKSDTEQAMRMLTDDGVIIWHDYDYIIHRDVFRYLNELSQQYPIYVIPNTRFAIYGKNLKS